MCFAGIGIIFLGWKNKEDKDCEERWIGSWIAGPQ